MISSSGQLIGQLPSFAALLLAALLGIFCTSSLVESAEGESTNIELEEEATLRGQRSESVACQQLQQAGTVTTPTCSTASWRTEGRRPINFFADEKSRNGLGAPLLR